MELYTDWLLKNYESLGEYFGSDPAAMNEIEGCKAVHGLVISAREEK